MKSNVIKRLLKYIIINKLYVIGALVCAAFSNILMILGPFIIGKGVDNIIDSGNVNFEKVRCYALIIIGLYLISAAFQWSLQVFTSKLSNKTAEDIRSHLFEHVTKMPLKFFDSNSHGDIMARLTGDIENISEGIFQSITQFITGIISIVGSLVFMFILNPVITLVVIVMTPITFMIAAFIARKSSKMFSAQSKLNGELNGYIEEIIGNQNVVKAFNFEESSMKRFEEINKKLYNSGRWAQFYSSLVNPSTRLVNNITYVLLGMTGGIASLAGHLSIGYISSFLTYSTYFSQPINNITSVNTQLQSAIASAKRVFAIMDSDTEKGQGIDDIELKYTEGNVCFEDITFSYNPQIPLIKNFSLKVNKGSRIAIVGPTGAGKTTMVNLLMRFYDVNSGNIYIDNININKLSKDSLRKSFGMV